MRRRDFLRTVATGAFGTQPRNIVAGGARVIRPRGNHARTRTLTDRRGSVLARVSSREPGQREGRSETRKATLTGSRPAALLLRLLDVGSGPGKRWRAADASALKPRDSPGASVMSWRVVFGSRGNGRPGAFPERARLIIALRVFDSRAPRALHL